MNLNKAIIVGRVTAQPELRKTQSGASVTSFSVATNRNWTDKNGARQEETEFHNIVCWGRTAEVASQFLTKGALCMVEGRLQTRSWQDQQGGNRKTTEIVCERLQLGPRPQGGGDSPTGGGFNKRGQSASPSQGEEDQSAEEDIPIIDLEDDDSSDEEIPF